MARDAVRIVRIVAFGAVSSALPIAMLLGGIDHAVVVAMAAASAVATYAFADDEAGGPREWERLG